MPCYKPLSAYRDPTGAIIFHDRKGDAEPMTLPCGRCHGCRLERSRQWAIRCIHEAKLHPVNSFVTLTYDNKHLPENESLNYLDYQKFIRKIRKKYPQLNLRYFMCGEYGIKRDSRGREIPRALGRPHYHAVLFGIHFPDRLYFNNKNGITTYTSSILSELWTHGNHLIGDVTFESAAYTARYIMKKITGDIATQHYEHINTSTGEITQRTPEFAHMSLKPGLGKGWLELYTKDVYPRGTLILKDRPVKPPRYYDKLFKRADKDAYLAMIEKREFDAYERRDDNTEARLAVKAELAEERINRYKREL